MRQAQGLRGAASKPVAVRVDVADRFAGICTPGAVWPADAIAEVAAAMRAWVLSEHLPILAGRAASPALERMVESARRRESNQECDVGKAGLAVFESPLATAPDGTEACFYRTAAGAEIDLVLTIPGKGPWAIEIKRSLGPKLERGFHHACEVVRPDAGFVVYPGTERYPMAGGVEAISLVGLCERLSA